jgi:hypothetical protein
MAAAGAGGSSGEGGGSSLEEGTGMTPPVPAASAAAPPRDYSSGGLAWYQPKVSFPAGVSPDDVPGPRAAHSCNLIGNILYVFGGW